VVERQEASVKLYYSIDPLAGQDESLGGDAREETGAGLSFRSRP
jgi:hypothetical protein